MTAQDRGAGELLMLRLLDSDKITVCAHCLCAGCLAGEFFCEEARDAGTVEITIAHAKQLNREHPDRWRELRRAEGVKGA